MAELNGPASNGAYDGEHIIAATSSDGINFYERGDHVSGPVNESSPALAAFKGYMWMTYYDTSGRPAVLVSSPRGGSVYSDFVPTPFSATTGAGGAGGFYSGDPGLVVYNGSLLIMCRSAFSEDNLWAIASPDGYNWVAPNRYGEQLTLNPSLAVRNNQLFAVGRTNYPKSGSVMWVYATADPCANGGCNPR